MANNPAQPSVSQQQHSLGEIGHKISARSSENRFKGGRMDKKKGNCGSESGRNGLVYAQ